MGSIISGVISLAGVCLTIFYTQKQYRKEMRNAVRPYISFYSKDNVDEDKQVFLWYQSDTQYAFIKKYILPESVSCATKQITKYDNGIEWHVFDEKTSIFYVTLKNIGNGVAKSLYFQMKDRKSTKIDLAQNERLSFCIYLAQYRPDEIQIQLYYENLYDDLFCINLNITKENDGYKTELVRNSE
jgi:hypothetical protein